MTRNKIQQENVQLKQQLLEERKKYEDEKSALIQKEISIREESQKNNEFLERISKAIGVSRSNPNFEKTVLSKAVEDENIELIKLLLSNPNTDPNLKSTIKDHENEKNII